ncbi:RIP metalloprotease RseP [bacterium]|nr:RIP metalloprotease RseP [bacterium]
MPFVENAGLMLGMLSLNQIGLILVGILGFIVAFGLAVFVHELGHFLAAKAFGVPVERFVIGFDKEAIGWMPRCIVEWRWGETTYGISLVPLGGYVKMQGTIHPDIERYLDGPPEEKDTVPASSARIDGPPRPDSGASLSGQALEDMAALYKKPFWQKIIIYGAGVVMNMILAMLAITALYTRGTNESAPFDAEVSWVAPTSRWADAPIQKGDKVVAVDGTKVANADELLMALSASWTRADEGSSHTLTLSRTGTDRFDLAITMPSLSQDNGFREDFRSVFFHMPAYIEAVIINDAADKAGIKGGDTIVSVDGVPMASWYQFREIVRASPRKELAFGVVRGEDQVVVKVTPSVSPDPEDKGAGLIGVVPGNSNRQLIQEPFGEALARSPERTWNFAVAYVQNLKRLGGNLAGGNVGMVRRELGGPVAIAQVAYRQAQKGFNDWLKFLIMLNVALAVMNILPLPVLDGGHICFAIYEAIFRRPVPPRFLVPLLNGAFIFLMVFFVLVTFNDVLKIFL